jgi:hypothetical protein
MNDTSVKLTLWRSPSGRLHLRQTCSGGGPANRMRRVRVTVEDLQATWDECVAERADPSTRLCRCVWRKVPRT